MLRVEHQTPVSQELKAFESALQQKTEEFSRGVRDRKLGWTDLKFTSSPLLCSFKSSVSQLLTNWATNCVWSFGFESFVFSSIPLPCIWHRVLFSTLNEAKPNLSNVLQDLLSVKQDELSTSLWKADSPVKFCSDRNSFRVTQDCSCANNERGQCRGFSCATAVAALTNLALINYLCLFAAKPFEQVAEV